MLKREVSGCWDNWVNRFKDELRQYLQAKWDEATEARRQSAVRMWGYRMDRVMELAAQKIWNEWVRYVSTKRRALLRRRLAQRAAAGGARIMVMGIMYARAFLAQHYLLMWKMVTQAESARQKALRQAELKQSDLEATAQKYVTAHVAMALFTFSTKEHWRVIRAMSFNMWAAPVKSKTLAHEIAKDLAKDMAPIAASPAQTRSTKQDGGDAQAQEPPVQADQQAYPCRHEATLGGDQKACTGQVWMRPMEFKRKGKSACALCAKHCGCGRKGCGLERDGQCLRVVNDEVITDEKWCRKERRLVQMEEEDEEDGYGDDNINLDGDDW